MTPFRAIAPVAYDWAHDLASHQCIGDVTLWHVFIDAPQAVLRICPDASAPAFWDAVSRRPDAPPAIDALLTGRQRVEVTAWEATQAIVWAENVDGWAAADPKPVFVHQPGRLHT